MELRVEPMSDVLGARVTGIDLRDGLDAATFAELRRIWLDHLVILLPGQDISSEQQAAFATGFGQYMAFADDPDVATSRDEAQHVSFEVLLYAAELAKKQRANERVFHTCGTVIKYQVVHFTCYDFVKVTVVKRCWKSTC